MKFIGVQTVLTVRQAIWRKEEGKWSMCGIPQVLYTDHGSDFTSTQLEYVTGDLKMQVVYSQAGRPRGRGKIECFFRTVEQLFAEWEAGYVPKVEWPPKQLPRLLEARYVCEAENRGDVRGDCLKYEIDPPLRVRAEFLFVLFQRRYLRDLDL